MATCGHASKLKVSGAWTLTQQRLQQMNGKTARSNPLHFDFCPNTNFRLKADVREDSADFYVSCDGDNRNDFDCILWVESDRESTEHTMTVNERVNIQHNGQSLVVHFKLVFNKQCPFCVGNQENEEVINFIEERESQSQRKRKLENSDDHNDPKKLKEELNEQNLEISKLNAHIETLNRELVAVKNECDQLKIKCEELEQTVQKAQDDYQRLQVDSDGQTSLLELLKSKLTMETAPDLLIMAISEDDEELRQLVIEFSTQNGGKEKLLFSDTIFNLIDQNLDLYKKVVGVLRQ
ncbi:hypothetical protein M3Y98_00092600 [Aphelenchoides besseyi]|nr:hypothetical protein M3Y98_00092600 [Aphelenchoides besseyi]KAI6198525.1 hypothetical protein M3Y96_00528300 [Aphelenchoides besseyi]